MSILHLMHRLGLQYRDGTGIKQLAEDAGMNPTVLTSKLNPNVKTHHLYASELELLVALMDTDEVAKYFAAQRCMFCVRSPGFDGVSDGALIDLIIGMEHEKAQWLDKLRQALDDGQITREELQKIKQEYTEFMSATGELMARVESFVEAGEARDRRLKVVRD